MTSKILLRLPAVLILLLSSSLSAAAPTAVEILDEMVVSYGGAAALEKLNRPYQQLWGVDALARNKQGTDQRTIDLPARLRVELVYPDSSETRILDGDNGEKIYDKTRHQTVQGPGLDAMRLQRMRLYNPLLLKRRAAEISITQKGQNYLLTLEERTLTTDYYVDKDSHMIKTVVGTLRRGTFAMQFRTEYSDYRIVEGVMLAHREVKYAATVNTAILSLQKTQFETTQLK